MRNRLATMLLSLLLVPAWVGAQSLPSPAQAAPAQGDAREPAVQEATSAPLIPRPRRWQPGEGSFVLDSGVAVLAPRDARSREIADFLRQALADDHGLWLSAAGTRGERAIELRLDAAVTGAEAYRIEITPQRALLSAAQPRGLFWAVQSLRQLLPAGRADRIELPAVRIDDAPRYGYRGHMLDVSRHFMSVDFIKKQLDLLSYYKINTFRWHLTDDQGWRIQIRRYPKLTQVGAWRSEDDGRRYGGYYNQAQIREVVEYARLRNIMVIPEIEMPGHASAALAAYPELSCRKQPIEVPNSWGVFKDVYCAGDESTFEFLYNVLDEVVELFPAPYVHIGGDEAPKDRWQESASSQQRMRAEGLKSEDQLQAWFVRRIQRYLAGKGKTLIGWDEILDGGLGKDAIVEVWRGDEPAQRALRNGNRIVVASPFYLDRASSDLSLEALYRTDFAAAPVFARHAKQVLGAEAPLWTERVTPRNAEAMLYPRLLAFAENTWSGIGEYPDFQRRVALQYPRLDAWQVNYGPESADLVSYRVQRDPEQRLWRVQAQRGFADLRIHYTSDGREPDASSPWFEDALEVRKPGLLKLTPIRHGRAYAPSRGYALVKHLGLDRAVTYSQPAHPRYRGNADTATLSDGVLAGDDHADGRWTAWNSGDVDATVDLGKAAKLRAVSARFLQQTNSWILPPRGLQLSTSDDGEHWTPQAELILDVDAADLSQRYHNLRLALPEPVRARYLRLHIQTYGALPEGHAGAGSPSFYFVDEMVIE
ncbi:family 20 glycosylhydrolase [Lysobacter sp. 5GHs7-4]|uniref:glycoside hydrolase family 20 protein n=1 Tax=Lysobacter sp. 5GHs7-4 TaxID=2904253 RepID=UPI001E40E6DE|nr:family 20 glycosylhydrolase [Lysobacter sp. 5GHs7-4]UHQ22543.1 family 20 glycosylhydrolase [Lysobacter sp. 5GHs7-4]